MKSAFESGDVLKGSTHCDWNAKRKVVGTVRIDFAPFFSGPTVRVKSYRKTDSGVSAFGGGGREGLLPGHSAVPAVHSVAVTNQGTVLLASSGQL